MLKPRAGRSENDIANHLAQDWLDQLEGSDYRWDDGPPPASEAEIVALTQFVGRPSLADYIAFLLDSRSARADGEYPISAINCVRIDWDDALMVAPDFCSLLLLRHELLDRERSPARFLQCEGCIPGHGSAWPPKIQMSVTQGKAALL